MEHLFCKSGFIFPSNLMCFHFIVCISGTANFKIIDKQVGFFQPLFLVILFIIFLISEDQPC